MITFNTSRVLDASLAEVFAAIGTPERLARWWGPAGFTNTFHECDFTPGGRWSFVMHGPDGANYPNENEFVTIEAPTKVVIRHVSDPKFTLTISLSSSPEGTMVAWAQAFEDDEVARRVEAIVVPCNEQNLDRLTEEVHRGRGHEGSE